MKLSLSKLKAVTSFNSGYLSGGIDYWVIYEFPGKPEKLLINSSGSNFGWEYDDWEFISKPSTEILNQLLDEKLSHAEKCKLILNLDRTSIYSLGLSKPE